jgi:ribosomal protein S18 acetylase RimI-like enzyme
MAAPEHAIRVATVADAPSLFSLINSAYHVETGDIPPAFKITTRFLLESEVAALVAGGRVLVYERAGSLLGVLSYDVISDRGALRAHFGPFAVATAAQGGGIGQALLGELALRAAAEGCASLDAEVVNHRHDLFPLYLGRLGFRVVGRAPFPAPERLSRPSHFVSIRRALARG